MQPATKDVNIKAVDTRAYLLLRSEAVKQGISTGEALRRAIMAWLSCERERTATES